MPLLVGCRPFSSSLGALLLHVSLKSNHQLAEARSLLLYSFRRYSFWQRLVHVFINLRQQSLHLFQQVLGRNLVLLRLVDIVLEDQDVFVVQTVIGHQFFVRREVPVRLDIGLQFGCAFLTRAISESKLHCGRPCLDGYGEDRASSRSNLVSQVQALRCDVDDRNTNRS